MSYFKKFSPRTTVAVQTVLIRKMWRGRGSWKPAVYETQYFFTIFIRTFEKIYLHSLRPDS